MIISEDYMIKAIMSESTEALSSGEISKKIYEKFKYRITKTTVKNYLWSSLRPLVHYNTVDWVYSLKEECEKLTTTSVFHVSTLPVENLPDYLRIEVLGDEVNCIYRDDLTVDDVLKALIELELTNGLRENALKNLNIRIKLNRIDYDFE